MKYSAEELKLGLQGGLPKKYQKIFNFFIIGNMLIRSSFRWVNVTYINFVVFK